MDNVRLWIIGCASAALIWGLGVARPVQADPAAGKSPSGATAAKAPEDAKGQALAHQKAVIAVNQAIAALAKEYEAHANDPTAPLREKSNYFKDNPAPEMTVDVILDGLSRVDGPTAEACYVKWQLLSGLPAKADDNLAPRIGDLYANAPAPLPNPSLTSSDKTHLDSQMMRMTEDQEATVNDAWTKHLADWATVNLPILNYSEALYGMLPEGRGAMTLGLQDAYQRRVAAGVDCDVFINQVLSDARDWAVSAQPEQLQAAADLCTQCIKQYSTTFPPPVYASVLWDEKGRQLRWQPRPTASAPVTTLTDFRKFLIDQANQPDGGLKIKAGN